MSVKNIQSFEEALDTILLYAQPQGWSVYAVDYFMRGVMLKLEKGIKIDWNKEVQDTLEEFKLLLGL